MHDGPRARSGWDRAARRDAGRDHRARRPRRPLGLSVAALAALLLATRADAAEPAQAALSLQGDVAYGEYLAGECLTCHVATGENEKIPPIVGWEPPALIRALYRYKTGARRHPVMQMVAGSLGDAEIAAVAAYLATIRPH